MQNPVVDVINQINDTNPGSEKKFNLCYLLVEKRYVTVNAKTVEEAYIKATKEVDRRIEGHYVSGFRFDNRFIIHAITFLKDGIQKFKGAPWQSRDQTTLYRGTIIEAPKSLDNTSQAA